MHIDLIVAVVFFFFPLFQAQSCDELSMETKYRTARKLAELPGLAFAWKNRI